MTKTKKIVGCKLLTADGRSSLRQEGGFQYQRGEWMIVPGKGAQVAITAPLTCGGIGPVLAYMECEEPTGAEGPGEDGRVKCYRRVRWIDPCPDLISRELRAHIAAFFPNLTQAERMVLAWDCSPSEQIEIAHHATDLSLEDRIELLCEALEYFLPALRELTGDIYEEDKKNHRL